MIPLEEYFARWPHTPNVEARLRRLNPNGIEEGCFPRGWYPTRTLKWYRVMTDTVSVRDFTDKWGKQVLMWVRHCGRLVNRGGKRRAVTYRDYIDPFRL